MRKIVALLLLGGLGFAAYHFQFHKKVMALAGASTPAPAAVQAAPTADVEAAAPNAEATGGQVQPEAPKAVASPDAPSAEAPLAVKPRVTQMELLGKVMVHEITDVWSSYKNRPKREDGEAIPVTDGDRQVVEIIGSSRDTDAKGAPGLAAPVVATPKTAGVQPSANVRKKPYAPGEAINGTKPTHANAFIDAAKQTGQVSGRPAE